ncbi:uncharacterized protein J3D65DRAFT_601150 [Phyllosticta citribraziliensis]|uniref:Uncharacterized protein n=1 Tax=Phyllosticta citribraziliensis TaxID=989973 RepID=A0ABR1M0Q6_9PEZI
MHGYGKVLLASLFASGSLALPWAQGSTDSTTGTQQTNTQNSGPSTAEIKSSGTGGKVAEGEPIPEVSEVGPAYSLLLAKEVAPTDLDGVIVSWAYGLPFCTQRQLLSESIEDFCNKNLTFDRVPKLDENLQATGEVTQISGYYAGCSDDVSLGRSYAGLYWVEVIGMYDGVGDQPAAPGGTDGYVQRTTNTGTNSGTPPTTQNTQNTQQGTQSTQNTGTSSGGTGNGGVRGPVEQPTPGKTAYKCNNDRESHECPRGNNAEVDIIAFASCGQYAYTDKKGEPGTGGSSSGTTSTTPPTTDNKQQQGNTQQSGSGTGTGTGTGGGSVGGRKYKTLRALKA